MRWFAWLTIFTMFVSLQTVVYADTANPPRIQSIDVLDSKIYRPGDVMRIRVNYTGGNPGLTGIYVDAQCLKSAFYAYDYSWERGRTKLELFSTFQYLNEPTTIKDQIVYATVTNHCSDGEKKLRVTIVDETQLSDNNQTRGIEKSFTVQGGQLLEPGTIRPTKGSDVIELKGIPASLNFDSGQETRYSLPRTSKNGQVVWWSSQGSCRVYVPFFMDAGGTLVTTGQGSCSLQAQIHPSDLFLAPEVDANVQFAKNNNWDFPKVGIFRVTDSGAAKAAEAKAKADAEAKAKADAEAKTKAEAEVKARLEAASRANAEAEVVCKSARGEVQRIKEQALNVIATNPQSLKLISSFLKDEAFFAGCPNSQSVEELRAKFETTVSGLNMKKRTITCAKGKLTKRITAANPKCPKGYTKK